MVRIEDITGKEREEKKKTNLICGLIKEVFGEGFSVEQSSSSLGIYLKHEVIAQVNFGGATVIIYNEEYLNKTKKFAEKYESLFLLGGEEVTIKTDYS